ncbi:CSN-associated deubiquitinating enzyme Ubp12 [Gaertneriomyces sp. JEL0708]|nr:CSN-associated deubiquitinating enzyme Ubp12 [Gaertneriomyces sp. JEL0708]
MVREASSPPPSSCGFGPVSLSSTPPIPISRPSSLKRTALEALSPDEVKQSPHIPRTPSLREFVKNGHRDLREHPMPPSQSGVLAANDAQDSIIAPLGGNASNSEFAPVVSARANGQNSLLSSPSELANMFSNLPTNTPPTNQEEQWRAIQSDMNHKKESRYYLLSKRWADRWRSAYVDHAIQDCIGPIDNGDLFTTSVSFRLKHDLKEKEHFYAVRPAIFHKLIAWFGIKHEEHAVACECVHDELRGKSILEVSLAQIKVVRIDPDGDITILEENEFSRNEPISEMVELLCQKLDIPKDKTRLCAIRKSGTLMNVPAKIKRWVEVEGDPPTAELRYRVEDSAFSESDERFEDAQMLEEEEVSAYSTPPQTSTTTLSDTERSDAVLESTKGGTISKDRISRVVSSDDAMDTDEKEKDKAEDELDLSAPPVRFNIESATERRLKAKNAFNDDKEEESSQPITLGYEPLFSTNTDADPEADTELVPFHSTMTSEPPVSDSVPTSSPTAPRKPSMKPKFNFARSDSYSTYTPEHDPNTVGCIGLNNLGNTCFMNSALQCLSNTSPLTRYFLKGRWEEELNTDNPLGMKGEVAAAYADLISSLWNPLKGRQSSFAPRKFKQTIGRFNSMFLGYSQQDSQELLAFLMDGLHEDLNRIKKKPYIEAPDMDGQPDSDIAAKAWEIYSMRNDSVIVDLFQGQYKSRVECMVCGKWSVTFDPYMFLSVPIPDKREFLRRVIAYPRTDPSRDPQLEGPRSLLIVINKDTTIKSLKRMVGQRMGWESVCENPGAAQAIEVYHHKIWKIWEDDELATSLGERDDVYIVEPDEPDWDLFEVRQERRTLDNVVFFPVYLRVIGHPSKELFGEPLMIALPGEVTATVSMAKARTMTEGEVQTAIESVLGERVYRAIVRALRRYSRIELFLKDRTLRLATAFNARQKQRRPSQQWKGDPVTSAPPSEDGEDAAATTTEELSDPDDPNLEFTYLDVPPEAEPICDLFKITLVTGPLWAKCNYRICASFYNDGFTRYTSSCLYDGTEIYKQRQRHQHIEEEDTTDADDESSDVENDTRLETHDWVRRPRSNSRGLCDPKEMRGDPEDSEKKTHTWRFTHCGVFIAEWQAQYADYILGPKKELFVPAEDESNDQIEREFRLRQEDQQKPITLQDCLDEYRKEETLGEDNSWYCPQCKEHRAIKKKLDIWTVPEILVFHLKRFSNSRGGYGYRGMMGDKLDAYVDAPVRGLDLTPVVVSRRAKKWRSAESVKARSGSEACLGGNCPNDEMLCEEAAKNHSSGPSVITAGGARTADPMDTESELTDFRIDPSPLTHEQDKEIDAQLETAYRSVLETEQASDADRSNSTDETATAMDHQSSVAHSEDDDLVPEDGDGNELVYDLFAVSNHFGGTGGGHYTAYAQSPLDGKWYNFDDSRVSPADESDVMTSAAYMLFYQRRRTRGPTVPLETIIKQVRERMEKEAEERANNPPTQSFLSNTAGSFLHKPSVPFSTSSDTPLSRPFGSGSDLTSTMSTTQWSPERKADDDLYVPRTAKTWGEETSSGIGNTVDWGSSGLGAPSISPGRPTAGWSYTPQFEYSADTAGNMVHSASASTIVESADNDTDLPDYDTLVPGNSGSTGWSTDYLARSGTSIMDEGYVDGVVKMDEPEDRVAEVVLPDENREKLLHTDVELEDLVMDVDEPHRPKAGPVEAATAQPTVTIWQGGV